MPPDFKDPLAEHRKAVLIGLQLPNRDDLELLLDELRLLLANLSVETVAVSVQKKDRPDPAYLIGSGKAADLKVLAQASGADLIVSNDMLTPVQLANLRKQTECEIWDRALVITKIFEKRAVTAEAKLQVELARCRYEIPHLRGLGKQMSNAGAGIGTRGPGETEFERHRRKLQQRVVDISRKLKEMQKRRESQRKQRRRNGVPTVALVGYTNSGKTTLLQRLCGDKNLYAADQLFATLDTAVRSVRTPNGRRILFTDTVGFIRELPPQLIAAFRTTLEEAAQADMLLIVLDINDPDIVATYDVIQMTLRDIGAAELPRVIVLNKIDRSGIFLCERVKGLFRGENIPVCALSALTGAGLDDLWKVFDWLSLRRD